MQWGLVGPILRAAGSDYDVRKYFPYLGYDTYDLQCPDRDRGRRLRAVSRPRGGDARERQDLHSRRSRGSRRSGAWACDDPRVVPPPKDKVYSEMEALIQHFLIYSQGFTVPAGEVYCARSRGRAASTAPTSSRTGRTGRGGSRCARRR